MAEKVELYPSTPPMTGFFSAWHGTAPFDLQSLMMSEEKLYAFYGKIFNRPAPAPYGVFLPENPVNAGGGMELFGSFVATFGPKTQLDDLKITLAHEMLHTVVGALDKPEGLTSSWYSEGIAVYYARLLALRAGQVTPAQFLQNLNTPAGRYYTDDIIAMPNAEIPERFWADTRIRVLPYDRGSKYFAVVDEEVHAASGGKRTLDDLLLAMRGCRKQQLSVDEDAWVSLVTKELGEKGKTEFDSMLTGATQLPDSDAFGPCFTRTTRMLRRYQLGFPEGPGRAQADHLRSDSELGSRTCRSGKWRRNHSAGSSGPHSRRPARTFNAQASTRRPAARDHLPASWERNRSLSMDANRKSARQRLHFLEADLQVKAKTGCANGKRT